MSSSDVRVAGTEAASVRVRLPAHTPSTWKGSSATGCQHELDAHRRTLLALEKRLTTALTAVEALERASGSGS